MDWLLLVAGSGAAVAYVAWWYRTREDRVRGWRWAAGLRATALILALLILINPTLPREAAGDGDRSGILLDASLSMSRPAASSRRSHWDIASDSVRHVPAVWLFGEGMPRRVDADSLPSDPPFMDSRLEPAIRAAAAAGARELNVLTDGGISDLRQAEETARRLGVPVRFIRVATSAPAIGIARIDAPRWATAGETISVSFDVVAAGSEADSTVVELLDDEGVVVVAEVVPVPDAGRSITARLDFRAPGRAGYHRYRVRLGSEDIDVSAHDNERPFYLKVAERPSGPVLLSLRPDWEASFLLPDLDRLTDAPTAAYMQVADSLLSLDRYRPVSRSTISARARTSPLLVVHGYTGEAPAWVDELIERARRVLVFTAGDRPLDLPGWGVSVGPSAPGEWYVASDLPASPVSAQLVGVATGGLAPLLRLRRVEASEAWSAILVQASRRGEPRPAVVAGEVGSRRWAVAAAEGYWRWAMRADVGRRVYRALWTGLAGWLLGDRTWTAGGLDPTRWVVGRDETLRWDAPSVVDSLVVRIESRDSTPVRTVVGVAGDTLEARLPPGRYRYEARAYRDGVGVQEASGPAEVEEFARELLPRPENLAVGSGGDAGVQTESRASSVGVGLARLGWPYLLLLVLFCTEWVVRRLNGLR